MPSLKITDEPCEEDNLTKLLATRLVNHILDEAYIIANAAREFGNPWISYMSKTKNLHNVGYILANMSDHNCGENEEMSVEVIATSTPQKGLYTTSNDALNIGQGDEGHGMQQIELKRSTSTIINELFDLSEVEENFTNKTDDASSRPQSNSLLTEALTEMLESCVHKALTWHLRDQTLVNCDENNEEPLESNSSNYSFVFDAINIERNVVSCISNDGCVATTSLKALKNAETEVAEACDTTMDEQSKLVVINNEVGLYGNTYITLNRDDDIYEDIGHCYPMLQNEKKLSLQDIQLTSSSTSQNNIPLKPTKAEEPVVFNNTVTKDSNASRKNALLRRCRLQGSKLLSSIRCWWRRNTPRTSIRKTGSIHGMCPLSPENRRAASLLDQRHMRSLPLCPMRKKFNTINEALVNSSDWNDCTLEYGVEVSEKN